MTEIADASAPDAEVVTLADGGRIMVRQLLPSDRDELAERYLELSPEGRRLRFFNAPDHLSTRLLDYLMDVDGPDRCALVAFAIDDEHSPGVGLARYVRSRTIQRLPRRRSRSSIVTRTAGWQRCCCNGSARRRSVMGSRPSPQP
jgi:hypothetical protein